MPASTGTDGLGGRLRAVHATASASTSRATRNFMTRSTPARLDPVPARGGRAAVRPGARAVHIVPVAVGPRATPVSRSGPSRSLPPRAQRCRLPVGTGGNGPWSPLWQLIPTPTGVRENSERTPSSSSSLVWKLGNEVLRAGQRTTVAVGPLWGRGGRLLSTR